MTNTVLVRHPDPTKDLEYLKTALALGLPVDVDYLFELLDKTRAHCRDELDMYRETIAQLRRKLAETRQELGDLKTAIRKLV